MRTNWKILGGRQLPDSIWKLLGYIAVFTKRDIRISLYYNNHIIGSKVYMAPSKINISETLYTRVDNCHGAGNCCRIPFDLVYTEYDIARMTQIDWVDVALQFGKESAEVMERNMASFISQLEQTYIKITDIDSKLTRAAVIYLHRHEDKNPMTGQLSCPYLWMSEDRYFCGIHAYKPLHCWYPHMTVVSYKGRRPIDRPTVNIGRSQYGRNHNFGCPVKFVESHTMTGDPRKGDPRYDYFAGQIETDLYTADWTEGSAKALGFTPNNNFAAHLSGSLLSGLQEAKQLAESGKKSQITLWRR